MSNSQPVLWEDLTWPEIPGVLAACGAAVLFPTGATEQHGPHLGTGVDTEIAVSVCREVSARTGVPVLPPLAYGCSLGHSRRWPGTLSLSPRTLIAVLSETGDWLHASGVRRLFFINSHVTNFAPVRCALEELRSRHHDLMVSLIQTPDISPRVRAEFDRDASDWHANAAESSLILSLRPSMARPDLFAAADDPDRTDGCEFAHPVNHTSTNGVTGRPSLATDNAGVTLFQNMVEDLTRRIQAGLRETPPLTNDH